MDIGETLSASTPADFRRWLEANHASKKDIWLVLYAKARRLIAAGRMTETGRAVLPPDF